MKQDETPRSKSCSLMKMSDNFPLYPEKFLASADVQLMSMEQFGVYCKVLFVSWSQERPCFIKNDEDALARLCGYGTSENKAWKACWDVVGKKFKQEFDYIYNPVLLDIWRDTIKKKKDDKKEIVSMRSALLNYTFEQFWNDYDKKVGNLDRIVPKWLKLSDKDREAIRAYIPKYKEAQPDKQFRSNPETFLNGHGWKNEIIHRGKKPPQNRLDYGNETRVGI